MKIPSLILSSILCASPSTILIGGVPDEPEKPKPPGVEKPAPDLKAKAEALAEATILESLRQADKRVDFFSRSAKGVFGGFGRDPQYTFQCVDSAPGDIKVSATVQPFKIYVDLHGTAEQPDNVLLTGFYDAKSKSIQLYDGAAKTYVAAAEHPRMKAKAALK